MSEESFVSKLGEVFVSYCGGRAYVVIFFTDGTYHVVGGFDADMDPMDLFKRCPDQHLS